ncbi:MAG: 4-hydroxybenzoate octaprenyltransferase, partial [Verrucomicrobiae bacterium]|nr:4-hydroxybenzoate octaprenyltransferase [Verrucomicrobiae bacterium]
MSANSKAGLLASLRTLGEFVKFSHTIFALPFALAAMFAAGAHLNRERPMPAPRVMLLIVAAMVCARTAAMAFN